MNHKPIIPWMGGKRRLAKHILPLIPEHTCYCEPFAGGAAILFLKPPSKSEVINDINGDLVNLYRVVKHHLNEFITQFKWALTSRKMFEWEKMSCIETLTDIQRAARFFYLQKLCFGGKVSGQNYGTATTSPPRLNLLRIEEDLSQAHLRLSQVNIENLSWENCITRYDRPHSFFYLDPPYWQTAGYDTEFGWTHYEKMAELMTISKGKFLMSINDHTDIRSLFKDFDIQEVGIKYSVGKSKNKKTTELIIKSY